MAAQHLMQACLLACLAPPVLCMCEGSYLYVALPPVTSADSACCASAPAISPAGHPVELVSRVAVLLLRLHHAQLMSTPAARPTLQRLHAQLGPSVQSLKVGMHVLVM
jgi:hypothetical protein